MAGPPPPPPPPPPRSSLPRASLLRLWVELSAALQPHFEQSGRELFVRPAARVGPNDDDRLADSDQQNVVGAVWIPLD